MYRHCIYCSADLGLNEAIERFPVGKSLAFDAAKGRLWAVCAKCSRWNLAPIEERWEAVEAAEKRFADTASRAQSENVGVARLADGTRLIRVGAALPGELAAWRFGEHLLRRRRRYVGTLVLVGGFAAAQLGEKIVTKGAAAGVVSAAWLYAQFRFMTVLKPEVVAHRFREGEASNREPFDLTVPDMEGTRLEPTSAGEGFNLTVPFRRSELTVEPGGRQILTTFDGYLVAGEAARNALRRTMANVNVAGGSRRTLAESIRLLEEARTADAYLAKATEERAPIHGAEASRSLRRVRRLALEMALHDDTERRALDGELAALERAWRDAEALASIADRIAAEDAGLSPAPKD